jgi:hypothetical protein
MKKKEEIWKDVYGFEGLYRVSSHGRIFCYSKTWLSGRWVTRLVKDQELKYYTDRRGYIVVNLRKENKQRQYKVHRLVAIAFVPNPSNKPQVNHDDTDKKNNHYTNLIWATPGENMQHAHDNGLMNLPIGEKHKMSKLKEDDVMAIIASDGDINEMAEQFGVCRATIQKIKGGQTWKHLQL